MPPDAIVILIFMTFIAAFVNGALGYGFSSVTLPVALIYYTNKTLNPALVLVEIILNGHVLWIHRESLPKIFRRILPIFWGLFPMILMGGYILSSARPDLIKLCTYVILIPLALCQAAGVRWPIRSEKKALPLLGGGVGLLYSVTTISGPPLALFLNNQGFSKSEFKSALGLIRMVQALLAALVYFYLGLYQVSHITLSAFILPGIVLAIPLGSAAVRNIGTETFRRIAMSFDAWIISFGLARLLIYLNLFSNIQAYSIMATVIGIDLFLLSRYFVIKARHSSASRSLHGAQEE